MAPLAATPPIVVVTPRAVTSVAPRQQMVVMWKPLEAKCSDGNLDITRLEKPTAQLLRVPDRPSDLLALTFRIDERGRAMGIKHDSPSYGAAPDLSPSLAASRFDAGKPRFGCSIKYQQTQTSITEAPVDELINYSIRPAIRPPRELFDRLQPAGSDCYPQRPALLLQAYPRFDRIPATEGRIDWSFVKFDIGASGKPQAIATYATTGNKALDKASIGAIGKSRYAKGARTGCIYPYWRDAGTVAAPASSDIDVYRDVDSKCPAKVDWKSKPALVYPEIFRRRAIEGWAIIAFDVAPWGGTGNVKLVAAEPAAEFGDLALNVIRAATVNTSGAGFSGCFERIRYIMGKRGTNEAGPSE